jgi:hypothetical protein
MCDSLLICFPNSFSLLIFLTTLARWRESGGWDLLEVEGPRPGVILLLLLLCCCCRAVVVVSGVDIVAVGVCRSVLCVLWLCV